MEGLLINWIELTYTYILPTASFIISIVTVISTYAINRKVNKLIKQSIRKLEFSQKREDMLQQINAWVLAIEEQDLFNVVLFSKISKTLHQLQYFSIDWEKADQKTISSFYKEVVDLLEGKKEISVELKGHCLNELHKIRNIVQKGIYAV